MQLKTSTKHQRKEEVKLLVKDGDARPCFRCQKLTRCPNLIVSSYLQDPVEGAVGIPSKLSHSATHPAFKIHWPLLRKTAFLGNKQALTGQVKAHKNDITSFKHVLLVGQQTSR